MKMTLELIAENLGTHLSCPGYAATTSAKMLSSTSSFVLVPVTESTLYLIGILHLTSHVTMVVRGL